MTRQRVLALAWNHGPVTVLAALLVMLACIWGASLGSHPASAAAAVSAPDRPGVTAEGIHDDLAAVLADQRQADRDHREAWIADGYSSDLATLVTDTDQAGGGTGALDAHARAFSDDGQAYLDAAGLTAVRPPPGWQGPYAQLRADLNRLAADEGLAPVPAPRGVISAAPGTADPKIPVPVPDANACASAGNTVTNSSSSTGASSHSVKAKTTCGTQSSSVTHKTSVTAKGAVTNTTTTTTSNGAGSSSSSSSGSSG